jgi:molybdopterin/thiamine biosynthesis adenylyltransferase
MFTRAGGGGYKALPLLNGDKKKSAAKAKIMSIDPLLSILRNIGLGNQKAYEREAFSRNIGLLTSDEQLKLSCSKAAIPGLGGVGGSHLIALVRSGLGRFHLADRDVFEPANVNRQYGARVPDFGRSKLEVMVEEATGINPFLDIKAFPKGLTPENMDDFLEGADVVLDGLDFFEFEIRRLLFKRAREKGIFAITAGPMGFSAAMLIFSPDEGMGFDEYFHIHEGMSIEEKYLAFAVGLAPKATHSKYVDFAKVDFSSKAGPSSAVACQLCSAMAGAEALKILLKREGVKPVPHYSQFDLYTQTYRKGYLRYGNGHPIQRLKMKVAKRLLFKKGDESSPHGPPLPEAEVDSSSIPEVVFRFILKAGIQAPSGDNAQPWRLSWQGDSIEVDVDPEADRSFFNVHQIASKISCGAVLENMRIAVTAFGLEGSVAYLPEASPEAGASLKLHYTGRNKDPLCDVIWKRCTNRKPYDRRPVSEEAIESLHSQIRGFPGARLHILTERSDLKRLAKIVYRVDRIRTEHRPLHEHLVRMIRFTEREAREKRDGFPLKNLEGGPAGEAFLKFTRPWPVMNLMNKVGVGRMVALHAYQGLMSASAAGLLTVPGMETSDFVRGGQALERIWLSLTQQEIAMQPMAAVNLFWLRWQLEGPDGFMDKHQSLLNSVWAEYQGLFPGVDFSREGHVMLFRLGFAKDIRHRTYRRDLDHFLVPPQDCPQ